MRDIIIIVFIWNRQTAVKQCIHVYTS